MKPSIMFPAGEHRIFLSGSAGQLEVLINVPLSSTRPVIGIVCHPHPLFGGNMTNKVVYTTMRAFKEMGLPVVRFNFRGVGKSEGAYDNGHGELEDLLAVINWSKKAYPEFPIWLAGFSFGSYIAACAAKKNESIRQLISIAPPVETFDFKDLPPFNCPWLVIQGDSDEIVSPRAVFHWLESLQPPPDVVCMKSSGHFFDGKLIELQQILVGQLHKHL